MCGGVQLFGGGAGCGGLGGVLLGIAEFGDGFGERGRRVMSTIGAIVRSLVR